MGARRHVLAGLHAEGVADRALRRLLIEDLERRRRPTVSCERRIGGRGTPHLGLGSRSPADTNQVKLLSPTGLLALAPLR